MNCGRIPYQIPIFTDNSTGILGLHWARQLAKSTVLAAWSVDHLLSRPGRLVTVLSNCQQNGTGFTEKCQGIGAGRTANFGDEFFTEDKEGNKEEGVQNLLPSIHYGNTLKALFDAGRSLRNG